MNKEKIKSFIDKRDNNLIGNNYELMNIEDDYNLIINYINNNKIKIILRKFNKRSINGWNNELILKIYDYEDDNINENIMLGSCTRDWKIINYKTKIKIIKKEYKKIKIPKIIYQTYINNDYHNIYHYNAVQSLIEYNPDYIYRFFNDKECREFIKINFENRVLDTYDRLYPGAYKADLFRYLIIYKYGGIYIDNKYIIRNSLDTIIKNKDNNVICKDIKEGLLFNSIIISENNNNNFWLMIERIIFNVKNKFYGECPLHPTGPRLYYNFFWKNETKLRHIINEPKINYMNCYIEDENKNKIINTFYNGYYNNKSHRNEIKNDYDYCYRNRLIYIEEYICINEYKFSILTYNNIEFKIKIINNKKDILEFKVEINNKKMLKKNDKVIIINNNNHNTINYDLIKVIDKVIKIKKE